MGLPVPAWHADALCQEYPDVDFFPATRAKAAAAKAVCGRCLVVGECLAWAVAHTERCGVWGGVDEWERRAQREERRRRPEAA